MSKILPFDKNDPTDTDVDGDDNRTKCPRYEKWIKKQVGHLSHAPGHAAKNRNVRRRGYRTANNNNNNNNCKRKNNLDDLSNNHHHNGNGLSFGALPLSSTLAKQADDDGGGGGNDLGKSTKKPNRNHHRPPLRSRSIFRRIRQKGRNFGIRCRTSVDLWRKWIKRGIGWDNYSNNHRHNVRTGTQTTKVNDFVKKSLINDVIPEEDEAEPEESSKTIEQKPAIGSDHHQAKSKDNKQQQQQISVPTIEINQKQDEKMQKFKNIFSKSAHKAIGMDQEKSNDNGGGGHLNNDNKMTNKEFKSIDVDRIESLSSHDQSKPSAADCVDAQGSKSDKSKGSLRRALFKLKIFF